MGEVWDALLAYCLESIAGKWAGLGDKDNIKYIYVATD